MTLPDYIDTSNASQIGKELHSLINGGATELIADMTATVSCDHSGADVIVHAYRHALINGTQLRLAERPGLRGEGPEAGPPPEQPINLPHERPGTCQSPLRKITVRVPWASLPRWRNRPPLSSDLG